VAVKTGLSDAADRGGQRGAQCHYFRWPGGYKAKTDSLILYSKRYSQVVNLLQLRYFVAIAEEGSFTRAAERLLVLSPHCRNTSRALSTKLAGRYWSAYLRGFA